MSTAEWSEEWSKKGEDGLYQEMLLVQVRGGGQLVQDRQFREARDDAPASDLGFINSKFIRILSVLSQIFFGEKLNFL